MNILLTKIFFALITKKYEYSTDQPMIRSNKVAESLRHRMIKGWVKIIYVCATLMSSRWSNRMKTIVGYTEKAVSHLK